MNDFWQTEESNRHINPNKEAFDPVGLLKMMCLGDTVDYGCGWGRLCNAFDPTQYVGVDISKDRIDKAKAQFPNYYFEHIETSINGIHGLTAVNTLLFYTSSVHMDDHEVKEVVDFTGPYRVVIVEVIGRRYRRVGNPPVFNREINDYGRLMPDYYLHAEMGLPICERPYPLTAMDWRMVQ